LFIRYTNSFKQKSLEKLQVEDRSEVLKRVEDFPAPQTEVEAGVGHLIQQLHLDEAQNSGTYKVELTLNKLIINFAHFIEKMAVISRQS
jgi:hypothetical protein